MCTKITKFRIGQQLSLRPKNTALILFCYPLVEIIGNLVIGFDRIRLIVFPLGGSPTLICRTRPHLFVFRVMRIKRGVGRTRYQLQALFCPRCPLLVAVQRNVNVTSSFLFSWEGRTFLSTFRMSHLHLYLSTLLLRCFSIFWTR